MKQRMLVFASLLLLAAGFQNCSKPGFESATGGGEARLSSSVEIDEMAVTEGSAVTPDRYVSPVSIRFGSDLRIGVVNSSANDSTACTLPPASEFLYELRIRSGEVALMSTQGVIYNLDAGERSSLLAILKGSMIARQLDFPLPANAANYACPQIQEEAYAELIARGESFMLGQGEPCKAKDLYKSGGGKAGLRAYLEQLEARLTGEAPPVTPAASGLQSAVYTQIMSGLYRGPYRQVSVKIAYDQNLRAFIATATATGSAPTQSCQRIWKGDSAALLNRAASRVTVLAERRETPADIGQTFLNLAFQDGRVLNGAVEWTESRDQAFVLTQTDDLMRFMDEARACLVLTVQN